MDRRNVKREQAEAIERMFGIERPQAFLLKSIPVLTVTDHAQVGFTQRRAEESLIDRMARLEVEGHR